MSFTFPNNTTVDMICFMRYHGDSRVVFHYFLQYTGDITHMVLAEVINAAFSSKVLVLSTSLAHVVRD